MKNIENLILEKVTNSAKTKFDFATFAQPFEKFDKRIPSTILTKTILGFATGKKATQISLELHTHLLTLGFKLDELKTFVSAKEKIFGIEILATKMAMTMLQDGATSTEIMKSLNQLL